MVTNGRRLADLNFTRRLKQSGLRYATFSIEGSRPEIHDATTQVNGSLQQALEGIRNAQLEDLKATTNTLISKLNICDLEDIIDLLHGNGIKIMSYNICGVCVSKESNNDYMVTHQEIIQAFERIYPYAKSKGINVRLVTPMPKCNFANETFDKLKKDKAIPGGPCHVVHGRNFVIDYNGDIVPCTHLTGYPLLNIFEGKTVISKESFITRYNSELPSQFRQAMNRYPSIKCGDCNENCSGGCPLFWIKLNPDEQIRGSRKKQ